MSKYDDRIASYKGIYVYDWAYKTGFYISNKPYRLIAKPKIPLIAKELPHDLYAYMENIKFKN